MNQVVLLSISWPRIRLRAPKIRNVIDAIGDAEYAEVAI